MTAAVSEVLPSPPAPTPPQGQWSRRVFQAPCGAGWVQISVAQLTDLPALPSLRALRLEQDGQWSVEEYHVAGQLPLGEYLTRSAAAVWVFVSIVQQCLAGLVALHRHGLRHGAISPRTLLVGPGGQVILTGCGSGTPWESLTEPPADGSAPPLPHALAVEDLRSLGLTFRAVLGGDPEKRLTVTRSDIAPLVAEWIDWLADPQPGRETTGAVQAETIFNEIRTGRPGVRPWQNKSELPPELGGAAFTSSASGGRNFRLWRGRSLKHGFDIDSRPYIIAGAISFTILAVGCWLAARFLKDPEPPKGTEAAVTFTAPVMDDRGVDNLRLPDEGTGLFALTAGDTEPMEGYGEVIVRLMTAVGKYPKPPALAELEDEARLRELEAASLAKGEKLTERPEYPFLYEDEMFPAIGTASPGREPGDYYLVWRTQGFLLTQEEGRAALSAILRTSRYCGVRVMSWTVLPNHAGVVLRVPPRRVIPDANLQRCISILRGEKTATTVIAEINARLKAGDNEGADQVRRNWTASMGSAAGFFSVMRTVPVLAPEVSASRPLWQTKPLRLALLSPSSPDLLRAATILDTSPVRGKLSTTAHEWPLNSLAAAMLNYGPALRAISVLMQKNPQADLPVPPNEDLANTLSDYRRHLGDLPAVDPQAVTANAPAHVPPLSPPSVPVTAPARPTGP